MEASSNNQLLNTDTATELAHFDSLYHQYHQAVFANIYKMVSQQQSAEDIMQEVFLALWENRHKLDAERVAGWLFVVSYNKAASYLKKKLKEPAILVQESILPDMAAQPDETDEHLYQLKLSVVEEAIDHLPARKKEVFRLCRFEGRSHDEVAALMGISVLSVKDYLKQSTQFIRQYVQLRYPAAETAGVSLLVAYFIL